MRHNQVSVFILHLRRSHTSARLSPLPLSSIQLCYSILSNDLHLGFLLYAFINLSFGLTLIYVLAPRHGRSNPIIYVSICSIFGSLSIMAVKGLGIAVKLTFAGDNQFSHPSTYVFGMVVASCILVQMNYFNKALDTFSTNV
jgi:magnesium transporter